MTDLRPFNSDDLIRFSKLSGDFNPIHLDPVYASRTQFRQPIVYGVLLLLSSICQQKQSPIILDTLTIKFLGPAFLDEKLTASSTDHMGQTLLTIKQRNRTVISANFSWSSKHLVSPHLVQRSTHHSSKPIDHNLDDITIGEIHEEPIYLSSFYSNEESVRFGAIHSFQLAILLAITRHVGMNVPGKYGTLMHLTINFSNLANSKSLSFLTRQVSTATRMVRQEILDDSGHSTGVVDALILHRPATLTSICSKKSTLKLPLKQKTVLITGASRGLGRAYAELFASQGANLILQYINNRSLTIELQNALSTTFGVSSLTIQADLRSPGEALNLVNDAIDKYSSLDYVLHCAHTGTTSLPITELSYLDFEDQCRISLAPFLEFTQGLLQYKQPCTLIGISSKYVVSNTPKLLPYITSKASLEDFLERMNSDLASHGLTYKIIRIGEIDTDMNLGRLWIPSNKRLTSLDVATRSIEFIVNQTSEFCLQVD